MSDTPTPSKGTTKRRGLALAPRGQALTRLQELEEEPGPSDVTSDDTASSNAVNTASSNAVHDDGSTSVAGKEAAQSEETHPLAVALPDRPTAPTAAVYAAPTRAVREPTTRITVDMPDSLHRKISILSVESRRSIKDLVIEALAATYFKADEAG